MKCIDEIPASGLKGLRVLVRAGLDLSLDKNGTVADDFRVEKALPTLRYLQNAGARIIILSHIGREPEQTNAPVAEALSKFIKVMYVPDIFGAAAKSALDAMLPGEIVLLENLRQHYDLEKSNDASFAQELASLGDLYVNDAFSNSHREHASMIALPKLLPHYAGLLLRDEVTHLKQALQPPHPALAIIGGAKFETKDPIVKSFLEKYDHVAVVGAIANDFLKTKGYQIGRSHVSEHAPSKDVVDNPRLLTSVDVTVERLDKQVRVKKLHELESQDKIVDMGPDTMALFAPTIAESKFILWNGPSGLYEDGYITWTHALALSISKRVKAGATAVIGGGNTISAIQESGLTEKDLGFFSTGGGAMLEFLLNGTLPAIDALN